MRIAAAQMGVAGLGALHLGGLGYSDTDVLKAGTVVTFGVHSNTCGITFNAAQDVTDDLNNWAGQMMQINSVTNTWEGEVPGIVDLTVNATVKQDILGGTLRGQIVAALAAISTCTLTLTNNTLTAAGGGTSSANTCPAGSTANAQGVCIQNTSALPWTTIAIAGALGLIGLVVVLSLVGRR